MDNCINYAFMDSLDSIFLFKKQEQSDYLDFDSESSSNCALRIKKAQASDNVCPQSDEEVSIHIG